MNGVHLTEKQLSGLPQYVQREIWRLARNLEVAQAALAAGPEGSNTFADPYAENPRPLGAGTTVRFGGNPDAYFDVAYVEGELEITGRRKGRAVMAVLPRISNVVNLAFMAPPSHG